MWQSLKQRTGSEEAVVRFLRGASRRSSRTEVSPAGFCTGRSQEVVADGGLDRLGFALGDHRRSVPEGERMAMVRRRRGDQGRTGPEDPHSSTVALKGKSPTPRLASPQSRAHLVAVAPPNQRSTSLVTRAQIKPCTLQLDPRRTFGLGGKNRRCGSQGEDYRRMCKETRGRGWSLERKMAFVDVVLGLCGFGLGLSTGIVIGYCFFIYFQHSNVKIPIRGRTMTGKRTVAPFLLLLIVSCFLQIWVSDSLFYKSFDESFEGRWIVSDKADYQDESVDNVHRSRNDEQEA
ncbi:uncharacterized protein LOC122055154 [Zingiber officinale]|uniref:uncharacterized protein LOC122055154 n=1 Tax=Zingiber officinale TaxID=94328 RepID=UPI001C4D0F4A|nr:uncharacterized protein LOC122055154 [Zingiber officinale]